MLGRAVQNVAWQRNTDFLGLFDNSPAHQDLGNRWPLLVVTREHSVKRRGTCVVSCGH